MSDEKKVKLEVPKSLMVVLWLIGGGLFVNGLQFLTAVEPAHAVSNNVVVMQIIDRIDELDKVMRRGFLDVRKICS